MKASNDFENLYEQYKPMVLQLCLGYAKGNMALAKDLTQDVFINVWHALSAFQGKSTYKTWIYRITANTCLTYIKKSKKFY